MKEGTRGEENMIIHVYKMMRREVERREEGGYSFII
jgi:hypothetical protein